MNEKFQSQSPKKVEEFCIILNHFGLLQPEELYKVICPFHADKNASMQISIPKAFFYCYGCGASGSTLELYTRFQQKEGRKLNELQALKEIQEIVNSSKGTKGTKPSVEKNPNNIYTIYTNIYNIPFVNKEANYRENINKAKLYYNTLPNPNWYKPSRNSSVEEETRICKSYMLKRGFRAKLLTEAGAKPSLNKYYPIIFPLLENGIFRGYVQRTFDKEIEQERKYLYNKGFRRVLALPGTFEKEKPILLVEGYLDCLAAKQLGIKYVAAILGWKVSQKQIQKLKRKNIKEIICGLDNDEAGNKGYRYLKRIAKENGFTVERIRYPKGIKDFGDLLNNEEKAKKVLAQCKKYFLF